MHHWETIIEGGDLEILWEDQNQAYGQTFLYEMITIVGFVTLLLLAWNRGFIVFSRSAEQKRSGEKKWFRRILSVMCVLVIIIFFIYWGYTPLSPISYGPISYVWTVIATLTWLTWTSVTFQQFDLVSEKTTLKTS